MSLDLDAVRSQFPALDREDVFLDNPGGTQVAQTVLDRMNQYLVQHNANRGGAFASARESDEVLEEARAAVAAFLNAGRPEEIAFGPNMTTLNLSLARAIGRTVGKGDTVVVTRLDHDANISPWMHLAQDRGVQLEWVDFDVEDGTLRLDTLDAALEKKPKLVAVGYASNSLGTINPIKEITKRAHKAGAFVVVDAVQYAPHGPTDVQDLGCDFYLCSAYKFFGPHIGILYGKYELMDELQAYKVRPAPKLPPGKWETGTQNHEGIAGTLGAMEYFEWLGTTFGGAAPEADRRARLVAGMQVIQDYEAGLSAQIQDVLNAIPGLRLYGLSENSRVSERVPTFSFTLEGWSPRELATFLGERGIYTWNGNYYALAVTERLGLEDQGGMLRIGAVHYNTPDEIERLGSALEEARSG